MTFRHSLAIVLGVALSTVAVAACGTDAVGEPVPGPSDPDPSNPDTNPPGPGPDVTPPTILSVTPEDGATKLKEDVEIVIQFNEPMNKVATEGAFSIDASSKTSGPPTMSWNEAGTVLTVDPKAQYTTGAAPDVARVPLRFSISTGATDLAGNALVAGANVSVSLYRHITQVAVRHDTLFGNSCADSNDRKSFIGAGDCVTDVERRGYASFVLPALPAGAELVDATLDGSIRATGDEGGNAFADFGDMHIEHVAFAAINQAAFVAPALRDLGVLIAAIPAPQVDDPVAKDVTDAVKDDYASGRALSQYRLLFKKDVPKVDGKTGMAHLKNADGEAWITLSYLVE